MNDGWAWRTVAVAAILVVAAGSGAGIRLYLWMSDRDRIGEEAEEQRCSIQSISWAWFPFFQGPFAGEWYPRGSRFYRVACRDRSGASRIAYVLIGPESFFGWDLYGRLTWRWAKKGE